MRIMKKYRIFGAPGCGKTTWIINKINSLVAEGTPVNKIMCLSFTNQTVNEFKSRLREKKPDATDEELKYFKTIHSICNQSRTDGRIIFGEQHYQFFKNFDKEEIERLYFLYNLKREKSAQLELEEYNEYDLEEFEKQLEELKNNYGLLDFTDMLIDFNKNIDIDYLFVDESQDLSYWQWKVVDKLMPNCKEVYIVLDDCQAIFDWAGANVDIILNKKEFEDIVLPITYRLPKKIFDFSQEILKDINITRYKDIKLENKKIGNIEVNYSLAEVDFINNQEYLILTRNVFMYNSIIKFCKDNNFQISIEKVPLYTEKQIKAVKDFIESGKEITINIPEEEISYIYNSYIKNNIKVNISTIHKAKGSECDNVVLFTQLTKTQYKQLYQEDKLEELKVLYVGVTRSRENLYIIDKGSYKYDVEQYF